MLPNKLLKTKKQKMTSNMLTWRIKIFVNESVQDLLYRQLYIF